MRQLRIRRDPAPLPRDSRADRVIEVDGVLDAVASHDLRSLLARLLATGHHHVQLDLSRVTYADADGIAGLAWCSEHAIETDTVLTWRGCSQPVLAALQGERIRSQHRGARPRGLTR